MSDYMLTENQLPTKGSHVEWLSPNGEVVRGKFLGGAIWMPEGSNMYVYYTPSYWRPTSPQGEVT